LKKEKKLTMNKETRIFNSDIEVRMEGEQATVRGYAAVFNSESNDLGGFTEVIENGAFDNVLGDDVRALIDHESRYVLGRTTSGTLRIGQDERGLWYEYDSPNTTYAKDLIESMQRGDINQSSFGFTLNKGGDKWEKRDGKTYRTIQPGGFKRLFDVSPVTYPAYPDTAVAVRSMDQLTKENSAMIEADKTERDQVIRSFEIKY
jgi:HK97 family phage prohead protease